MEFLSNKLGKLILESLPGSIGKRQIVWIGADAQHVAVKSALPEAPTLFPCSAASESPKVSIIVPISAPAPIEPCATPAPGDCSVRWRIVVALLRRS